MNKVIQNSKFSVTSPFDIEKNFNIWYTHIAILSGILAIAMLISVCQNATAVFENGTLTENLIFTLKFFITLFTIGFCIFSIFTAKEIEKENDKTYIASMFSNIVAIAALVVAIVALMKGAR